MIRTPWRSRFADRLAMGASRSPAERAATRARLFPYGIADAMAKPVQKHPRLRRVVPEPVEKKTTASRQTAWHFITR